MTFPFRFDFALPIARWLALCLGLVAPSALHAAALSISVTVASGKPLIDAVALFEPASGRQPMTAVEISQAQRRFQPRTTVVTTGTRAAVDDAVQHVRLCVGASS